MVIYEAIDHTDDEMYYPIGLWLTLDDAIAALEQCADPSDLGSDGYEWEEGFCRVEIRERHIGWPNHDLGNRKVAEVTWKVTGGTHDEKYWTRELSRNP